MQKKILHWEYYSEDEVLVLLAIAHFVKHLCTKWIVFDSHDKVQI